jgi:hypothetical protein
MSGTKSIGGEVDSDVSYLDRKVVYGLPASPVIGIRSSPYLVVVPFKNTDMCSQLGDLTFLLLELFPLFFDFLMGNPLKQSEE